MKAYAKLVALGLLLIAVGAALASLSIVPLRIIGIILVVAGTIVFVWESL